jgi:4-diphosphocytidyl-2-C-methyl-D-erythritol kinase
VFEPIVRARFPAVAVALDWLGGFGEARLSGSGGCVFVPVASRDAGLAVLAECPPGMRGVVVQGVAESPLRRRLVAWHEENGS